MHKIRLQLKYDILIEGTGAATVEQLITDFVNKVPEVKKSNINAKITYLSDKNFDKFMEKN